MALQTEIKDFTKKVLLLGIILSFLINLIFTYVSSLGSGSSAYASGNDGKFRQANIPYLGNTGVAIAMNIGLHEKEKQNTPVNLYAEVMPIGEVLADTGLGRQKLISSNMVAASEYLNVLKTDVNKLLDSANDREAMLESFLDQLKYRYTSTNSYLSTLSAQVTELQGTVTASNGSIETTKTALTAAYKNLDYDRTEELLTAYLAEKQKNTYAATYLVFLGKFISTYQILNAYNKTLLDTLINNKEALIKNVTVIMPDSGTSLMKQLNLVKTEAEWKARQ
ncbi:MAG: hypothetical protein PHN60_03160 [Candidatus Gracilibacteria bacterium]|nr:hypothetical protein [Candidatus Gracilibacteria bacterium]